MPSFLTNSQKSYLTQSYTWPSIPEQLLYHNPWHPCMVYLPAWIFLIFMVNVGKYTHRWILWVFYQTTFWSFINVYWNTSRRQFSQRPQDYQNSGTESMPLSQPRARSLTQQNSGASIYIPRHPRCINLYTQTSQVHQFIYPDIPGASIYIPRHPRCINLYTQTSQVHQFIFPDIPGASIYIPRHSRCINLYTQTSQVHQFIYPDIPGASIYIPRHPRCINLYTQTSQVHQFIPRCINLYTQTSQVHQFIYPDIPGASI